MPNAPSELRQSLWGLRPLLQRCAFYAWISGLLGLVSTYYMFEVYDRVVNSRSTTTLLMLTLLALSAYAVMEALEWARSETLRLMGRRWDAALTCRLYQLSCRAAMERPDVPPGQALLDFRSLRDGLMNPAVGALLEVPLALVFLLLLFAFHPLLGWTSLLGAGLQVMITAWNEHRSGTLLHEAGKASVAAQASVAEALRFTQIVSALGMHQAVRHRWEQWQSRLVAQQALASDVAGGFQALSKFLQSFLSSLLLGLSAYLVLQNALPGGGGLMIVASVLGARLLSPLVIVVTQWRAVGQLREAWVRLAALMAALPVLPPAMPLPAPRGHLVAEGVWAAPPGSNVSVVRGVQLSLPPGQCLAVIGLSGAGKSSLARLLVGAWAPGQGKVRIDGADLHTWDKAALGPYLGYLPQEVHLLEGTLAENITRFGAPKALALQQALSLAGLETLVSQWPLGLETPLGREGLRLSAGQRQRVGLARALYGDPVLVVLDEPNAHLDQDGEQILLQAVQSLKARGATVVLMTHRNALLAVADQLLILREGASQAYGPRDEVIRAMQKAAAAAVPTAGVRT
jgi:ATP-binding cassette subfamily C exporter for protease/lipase